MALKSDEIRSLIKEAIPDAEITIQDLAGDENHYSATIKSKVFSGKSKIEQHKLVYKALKGKMGNELHALALNTMEIWIMNEDTKEKINDIVKKNEVCLFMKGTPEVPQCGFSLAVSNMLKHLEVNFKGINVLEDQEIREGIKAYSDWPTIPQLYIKGEFIGGCDIVKEMFEKGELQNKLEEKKITYKK